MFQFHLVHNTDSTSPIQRILRPILDEKQTLPLSHRQNRTKNSEIKPIAEILSRQRKYLDSMQNAKNTLSKFNNDKNTNDSWLISTTRKIIAETVPPMTDYGFQFHPTKNAAKFNHTLLKNSTSTYKNS